MNLINFIIQTYHIDLTDSKVTLNNCKNDFDPMVKLNKLKSGELPETEYANTIAWIGQRNQQLFKPGTYIVQLVQKDRHVRDRFILGSIAKVVEYQENPDFKESDEPMIEGDWSDKVGHLEYPHNDPRTRYSYKLERIDLGGNLGKPFEIRFKRSQAYQLDIAKFGKDIHEVTWSEYTLETFPGFKNFGRQSFESVRTQIDSPDWHKNLSQQKGIYMLHDNTNGKKYIGSASGKNGFYQRWNDYLKTGHGGDKGLIPLGTDYILKNFSFSILECCPDDMSFEEIIERESYYKELFDTRTFGYNEN